MPNRIDPLKLARFVYENKPAMKTFDRAYIEAHNRRLKEYMDWMDAMNAYRAGRRNYIPSEHGPIIARMYGENNPVVREWSERGYPRVPMRGESPRANTISYIMYDNYMPDENMRRFSYPGTEEILDDIDWAIDNGFNKAEVMRRNAEALRWYDMNYLDPDYLDYENLPWRK